MIVRDYPRSSADRAELDDRALADEPVVTRAPSAPEIEATAARLDAETIAAGRCGVTRARAALESARALRPEDQ